MEKVLKKSIVNRRPGCVYTISQDNRVVEISLATQADKRVLKPRVVSVIEFERRSDCLYYIDVHGDLIAKKL